MSDALQYLLTSRPEAMGAYFKFMKAAGRGLDPKTRALISVITKVGAQTESGLKQYLTRALQLGVTPNEVLDAMLMAFPMLGLTKITWAIDIILTMEIPEFSPVALHAEARWHRIASMTAFTLGTTTRLACDEREVFVYRSEQTLRVYDSRCPHQITNIPALALQDKCLTCPKHGWVFDISSGLCTSGGDRPLREFPHKVDEEFLLAYW
jgi:nitrite reductase/ring-hydroxylating ferredoxin subunit/alkylhydroperoxidase/carboxymuconolactone decarboxylase family protein YurZ